MLTEEMSTYKEQLMEEWMLSLKEEYGEKNFMDRFRNLMLFYYEVDVGFG
jgi:hypothetical protein